MDDVSSTTIALAGIIATALVGIVAPIVAAVTGWANRREEHRATREDELRAVAETAAIRLTEALMRLDQVNDETGVREWRPDVMRTLREDLGQLFLNEDRLNIRLGPDAPESRHYHDAVTAWQRAYSGPNGITVEDEHRDRSAWARERMAAHAASQAFKAATAARIGPDASARARRLARDASGARQGA